MSADVISLASRRKSPPSTRMEFAPGATVIGDDNQSVQAPFRLVLYLRMVDNGSGEQYLAESLSPKAYGVGATEADAVLRCIQNILFPPNIGA